MVALGKLILGPFLAFWGPLNSTFFWFKFVFCPSFVRKTLERPCETACSLRQTVFKTNQKQRKYHAQSVSDRRIQMWNYRSKTAYWASDLKYIGKSFETITSTFHRQDHSQSVRNQKLVCFTILYSVHIC